MYVYAGIDEAGYGPLFGPLLVGRMVLGIPHLSVDSPDTDIHEFTGPQLWNRLADAVCRDLTNRKGRIAVNDSKKLRKAKTTTAAKVSSTWKSDSDETAVCLDSLQGGAESLSSCDKTRSLCEAHLKSIEHLERGALAFSAQAGFRCANVSEWLDSLGENSHHKLDHLPWYAASEKRPWESLPRTCSEGEIAVARSLLSGSTRKAGVNVLDLGAAVAFEDRFNQMVSATRSKAAVSFTFVAGHLRSIWDRFGECHPRVVVDRQSGRTHYRELLSMTFPEADLTILDETPAISSYRLEAKAPRAAQPKASIQETSNSNALTTTSRAITISFEVDSEQQHMPVALASMVSKYTRELLMSRFQAWFLAHAPHISPTAGYAADAKRFWKEIQPELKRLSIDPSRLVRLA